MRASPEFPEEPHFNDACRELLQRGIGRRVLANESYVSDIAPHEELLRDVLFDLVSVPNLTQSVIHVRRADVSPKKLKMWEQVVTEMMAQAAS